MDTTHTIAGHKLTLTPGETYRAQRPFASRNQRKFSVSIVRLVDGTAAGSEVVLVGMTYEESNEFLNAFNNGTTSFEGRVWS